MSPEDFHKVQLEWITPDAERLLLRMAKVSNPSRINQPSPTLIRYLIDHGHWSPFEMVNICFHVRTTRDIGRQLLRHSTARPQEFSQRYASIWDAGKPYICEARLQHETNRQQSNDTDDLLLHSWWKDTQKEIWALAGRAYQCALDKGIAKEVARQVLPGMAPTSMFLNFPLRTLIHFFATRSLDGGAQREIVVLAQQMKEILREHCPATVEAVEA